MQAELPQADMDLILKFLTGDLNEEEQLQFEQKKKEPAFLKELTFQEQLSEVIQSEEELSLKAILQEEEKQIQQNINPTETAPPQIRSFNKWWAVAAAIALLIATFFLLKETQSPNPETQFAANFQPYPNVLVIDQRSLTHSEEDSLRNALSFYENQQYPQAIERMDQILKGQQVPDPDILFYKALSLMASQQIAAAIPVLENIKDHPQTSYSGQTTWYLGLAYLKAGDQLKAKALFRNIANGPAVYKKEAARQLLEALE